MISDENFTQNMPKNFFPNTSKTYKSKYHGKFTINDMCFISYPCCHNVTVNDEEPVKMTGE